MSDVLDAMVADASDARYAKRGATATRCGDVVTYAKDGRVVEMIARVGDDAYVTAWEYAAGDWRVEVVDASEVAMRGSWAIESAAFDK